MLVVTRPNVSTSERRSESPRLANCTQVALNYSDGAEARLLFKLTTSSFLERGADLQFLSAFPGEVEFLYPPLTFLDPTGCEEVIETDCGIKYTVVEVQPRI